ncbi:hypothetical protein O204_11780 [Pseudomonas simiae]|uniref:Uncharacterized protein n=1 Tax=Pseudomonas simiae TaxID=321846 RepID=U1U0F1_9PSED|nr:hypothetical protein O204_11780 [Pseudomonas simiae]
MSIDRNKPHDVTPKVICISEFFVIYIVFCLLSHPPVDEDLEFLITHRENVAAIAQFASHVPFPLLEYPTLIVIDAPSAGSVA